MGASGFRDPAAVVVGERDGGEDVWEALEPDLIISLTTSAAWPVWILTMASWSFLMLG